MKQVTGILFFSLLTQLILEMRTLEFPLEKAQH